MSSTSGDDSSELDRNEAVSPGSEQNDLSPTPPEPYEGEPLPGLLGEVQTGWRLFLDPRVPAAVKLLPFLVIAVYFLVPVDLVPDPLLGAGQMDDLGILAVALFLFRIVAPTYLGVGDRSSGVSSHMAVAPDSEQGNAQEASPGSVPALREGGAQPSAAMGPPQPGFGYGPPNGPVYVRVKGQGNCGIIMLVLSLLVLAFLIVVLVLGGGVVQEVTGFVRNTPAQIAYSILHGTSQDTTPSPIPSPTPVDVYIHLKTVGKLEVLHYTTKTVMDEKRHDCVVGEERLLYVAHGEAVMGVDLEKMKEGDITVEDRRVVLQLPPVEAFHAFLDVESSYVFDHWIPVVCPDHKEEMIKAAQVRAKSEIEAAADSDEVRKIAETYSKSFLQLFLLKLGFEEVVVVLATPEVEGLGAPLTSGAMEEPLGSGNTIEPAGTPVPTARATGTPRPSAAPTSTRTPSLDATSTLTVTVRATPTTWSTSSTNVPRIVE